MNKNSKISSFKVVFSILVMLCFFSHNCTGQRGTIQRSGDIIQFVVPSMGMAAAVFVDHGDDMPVLQLTESLIFSTLITHSLKRIINKKRPNGGRHAFPSGHTTFAMTGAGYIQRRYGWEYGIPAYALAAWVGYSRIHAKKHDIYDVVAGTIVGVGSAYLFTKPIHLAETTLKVVPTENGIGMIVLF